jgi:hypothetical protein
MINFVLKRIELHFVLSNGMDVTNYDLYLAPYACLNIIEVRFIKLFSSISASHKVTFPYTPELMITIRTILIAGKPHFFEFKCIAAEKKQLSQGV